jgi:hypothetical protein
MPARRPDVRVAAVEVAFVALSGIAGAMGEPFWWVGIFLAGSVAHWAWSRRRALGAMEPSRLVASSALALAMIGGLHLLLFWLGSLMHVPAG